MTGLLEVEQDKLARLVITRDTVEEVVDKAAAPMRAGRIAAAMGSADTAAKREGLRAKPTQLVERGWAAEEPGLFIRHESSIVGCHVMLHGRISALIAARSAIAR
ncbi:hypothetical protein ACQEU3_40265 [Spirillospora sp. CA-253888]